MTASACPNCGHSTDPDGSSHLENARTDPQQQLADLDSEVVRVIALLRQLRQKRSHLRREINAQSLVLQLPLEITCEIFAAYLADNGEDFVHRSWMRLSIWNSPLLFGKVCRAWREIAWSRPSLWCSMRLPDLQKKLDFELVDGWLKRLGTLPLSIYAALPECSGSRPNIVAIMDVIAEYSERWQNIYFELPMFCYDALKRVESLLPILRCIGIESDPWAGRPADIFSVAPLLRHLYLKGDNRHHFILPTDQMTKLTLEGWVSDFLGFLQDSPNVVSCRYVGLGVQIMQGLQEHVIHSQLETLELTLEHDYYNLFHDLFDALTLPALRVLSCFLSECDFPASSFISLMTRSSCSLQTLNLEACETWDYELAECLRAIPSLKKLLLREVTVTNEILQLLNPRHPSNANHEHCLLPNLTDLGFLGPIDNFELDFIVVVDFLRSRWLIDESTSASSDHVARLQSARFCNTNSGIPDAHTLTQLRHLVSDGMVIELDTFVENG